MIRIAIDSDKLGDLPAGVAPLLLTYADLVPTRQLLAELEDHHRGSQIVLMDRGLGDPLNLASEADVETAALQPGHLPTWFDRKTKDRIAFLTVYCNQVTLPAVEAALRGTPYQSHWRHVARLDGIWDVPGFRALYRPALVQVVSSAMLGIHADGSIVLNPGWHPAAQSVPAAADPAAEMQDNGGLGGSTPEGLVPEDMEALQARCPGWTIRAGGDGYEARREGTRVLLTADSVFALAARIEALYPGSITP